MKLIRFGLAGEEKPGLLRADGVRIDASGHVEDYNEKFFQNDGLGRLQSWCDTHGDQAPVVDDAVRWAPPVARPSKIVCIGHNYAAHARESSAEPPSEPVVFFKSTSSFNGPNDDVMVPRGSTKLDYEVELAVIIGRVMRYVDVEQALDYVAGYALHNDYSERSFQKDRGGQWVKGKSCDTFAPLGPFMVTADETGLMNNRDLWLRVNGEIRQQSNTADMIFDVPFLLSYLSQFMTLLPGDIISTGTPSGVGMGFDPPRYLSPGDTVEMGLDGLGQSSQRIVAFSL
jgi:2-keto-4-pentenoate hydratase/2-oxohepta-3-ene-1,7-dioic acid hydratase in catechol pathway